MGRTLLMCRGFQELTGAGIRGRAVNGPLKGHWGKGDREARFSKYTEREMDSARTSPVYSHYSFSVLVKAQKNELS